MKENIKEIIRVGQRIKPGISLPQVHKVGNHQKPPLNKSTRATLKLIITRRTNAMIAAKKHIMKS